MTTDTIGQTPDGLDLVAAFRAAAPQVRERKFWITLGIAFLLHAMLLIGAIHSAPRQIGDPKSAPDAVSVSFVTEAELKSAETGSEAAGSKPSEQPGAPPPPPPQPQQEEQQAQPETPPHETMEEVQPAKEPPKAEEAVEKEQAAAAPEMRPLAEFTEPAIAEPKKESKPETKKEAEKPADTTQELAKAMPDLLELPDPATAQRPAQKQQQAKKQQKQAMRAEPDMSVPPGQKMTAPSFDGRSAGVERPPGITRSGANDDFARKVVSALRQTMPQMNVLGRLTVKIIINENGNIQSVDILARSESTDLNRAVVFSTKQASFPFPPPGSTVDDRTFTITYIYH